MPAPKPLSQPEPVKDLYWRLNQPMSGSTLEVYFQPEDDWLPAKFVTVPEDGRVLVKWNHEGKTVELPSHLVRNVGDGTEEGVDPPLKRYLRTARPDWEEGDINAVLLKLKIVGIVESRPLYESVLDDLNGYSDGINGLLRANKQKRLVPRTLTALKSAGELMLSRRKPPADAEPSVIAGPVAAAPAPRQPTAQRAADERNGSRAQEAAPLGSPVKAGPPRTRDSDSIGIVPPKDDADLEDDEDLPAPSPSAGFGGDSFLASLVRCKKGHVLKHEPTPYDVNCDDCGEELDEGALLWRCDPCAYDLCNACQVAKQRQAARLPTAPKQRPSSPPRREARAPVMVQPEEPQVYCPNRHALKHKNPSHPVECNYCGQEMTEKVPAWSCDICGYYLCKDCHADKALD